MTDQQTALRDIEVEMQRDANDLAVLSDEDNHNAQVAARSIKAWADRIAALIDAPAEARPATCPMHGDPLVCLSCEADEDARPEWAKVDFSKGEVTVQITEPPAGAGTLTDEETALAAATDDYLHQLHDLSVPLDEEFQDTKARIITIACLLVAALRGAGRGET